MNKISIIIPCYNTEKYIDKCIKSILNQSYKDIELILVDDCSTDNTLKIITDYSKNYSNIKVIKNDQNKGAGYSRNIALREASCELISFIDSDDYVEENYYKTMIDLMEKDKSDVVICDIFVKYEEVEGTNTRNIVCKNPNDKYSFIDNGLAASPCNKLLKKEDLLKYPFPEGIMNEDIATIIPILINAKKISYNKDTYYNYIQRKTSVQNSKINNKRFDLFKSLDILEKRVPRTEENKKYWDAIIYNQIITFLFYYLTQEKDSRIRIKYLKEFNRLSKKYNIKDNPLLESFYNTLGPKHRYYYKGLMNNNVKGLYLISNNIISFYHWYSNSRKSVIKDNIELNDIIELAKYQNQLPNSNIKISVVIPNYNYEKFLLQRLYSILNQSIKLYEIIILDDLSTDNSRELIDKIEASTKKYITIRKVYNTENSGTAFKQWRKGFEEATGDYVWIAEADDYCNHKFLSNIVKPFMKDKEVVISYSDTAFIDKNGYIIMKSIKPEIDILKTGHWNHNFINDGKKEINEYAYLNCTIANVSSVLFKNNNYEDFFETASKFKQAGDWLFYLQTMSTGKIAYCDKALNYYRVHGENVTSLTKKENHLSEIKKIHSFIEKKYGLNKVQKKHIEERYEYLRKKWEV